MFSLFSYFETINTSYCFFKKSDRENVSRNVCAQEKLRKNYNNP